MNKKRKLMFLLLGIAALVCIVVVIQVFLRKPATTLKLAGLSAGKYDPAIYESYKKNLEMAPSPTGFGGSEKVQKSVKEPEILVNFKGMAFSKDYAEDRGHPYAVQDLKETKRVNPTTPGACMTCKSSNLIDIYKDMG